MLLFDFSGESRGLDPLILLLVALLIDASIGETPRLARLVPHPVRLIGRATGWLDRRLNRPHRSDSDRRMRGVFVVAIVCAGCAALGWAVAWLSRNHDFGWIVEVVLTAALLAQRSLFEHVRAVSTALKMQGLQAGQRAVAHIVGRDVRRLDEHGVARAAIESCAENYSDAVVAPVFWYVLLGFPGLLVFKAVNTMDSMIGYRTERHRAFGFAAARLDDVLNFVPARIAALFIAAAAVFVPTASPAGAFRAALADARKHRSPNAGWPEAAAAGALGLALAGPRRYAEITVDDPWIGDGRARATAGDIDRALFLYVVACLINALAVAQITVVRLAAG